MPVMAMVWKSWRMALWNAGGMCFSSTPGMLSGPGALCPGSLRNAFLKDCGCKAAYYHIFACGWVVWYCVEPWEWISWVDPFPFGAYGERALVSSCSIILLTCAGSLVILPVLGSRMEERFVGAV